MGTTGIQVFIILVYIGVLFGISWYVKHKAAASTEAYVLAGRKLTTPLIMVSIVGLAVGGANRPTKSGCRPVGIRLPGASGPSSWA